MARKTYNEKLNHSGDLPKVEFISPDNRMAQRLGSGLMLIAAPVQYDEVMKRIPEGRLTTADAIRAHLARKHDADFTCPLTAGIFINIAANASEERANQGLKDMTPYWRTVRKNGELNEKYPGGTGHQKVLLELEGHEVAQRGKRYFVRDYENALYELD